MKPILFIDTNIYLRFYDSNSKEFSKLLELIERFKENIFITEQIKNEIERNKLDVFVGSFISYKKQFDLNKTSLPIHLEETTETYLEDWNNKTQELLKEVKEQKTRLNEIAENFIDDITTSKDKVSQTLKGLYTKIQHSTDIQIEKAKLRKEKGNPPGKFNDPLGDQVSWEQLLDTADSINQLWVITNDTDFMIKFGKKCHLNPFLIEELKMKNDSMEIHCFDTLSEGLRSFNQLKPIPTFPTDDEIKEITEEELNTSSIHNFISGSTSTSGSSNQIRYQSPNGPQGLQDLSSLFGPQGPQSLIHLFGQKGNED